MVEKFEKIVKFYDYGSIIALSSIAFAMSGLKGNLFHIEGVSPFAAICSFGIFYLIFSFMFAGIMYGFSLHKIKLTLNPIKLIIDIIISSFLCEIFSILYFFIFIYYLIMSTKEKHKKAEAIF